LLRRREALQRLDVVLLRLSESADPPAIAAIKWGRDWHPKLMVCATCPPCRLDT
jgi:hypothetical protein